MIFTFVLVCFATFWAWEFIRAYVILPDYAAHLLVPAMAFGAAYLPFIYLAAIAAGAVVGLLHKLILRFNTPVQLPIPRRRSNIPPAP